MGDAILDFVVSEQLYLKNPLQEEGYLSQQRAFIVGRKHLNLVGKKIIPESEIKNNLKLVTKNIYGNVLEALIGAIYLDKGIEHTQNFIFEHISNSEFIADLSDTDYKSKLLEISQRKKIKVEYKVLQEEGPDHRKEFLVAVFVDNKQKAEGKASSIKEAEQKAAKKAFNSVF